MKNKTIVFFATLIVPFLLALNYPKPEGHVSDFAGIVEPAAKKTLEKTLRDYEKQTGIEIAVVTVSSLGGESIEEYTTDLFREWGVGEKKENNGVVLLVAPNERKVRIEPGYGIEGALPDVRANRIIQKDILPYFKQKPPDYTGGIVAGVNAIIERLTRSGLGKETLAEREEKKRLEEEQMARELIAKREAAERFKNALPYIFSFLGFIACVVIAGIMVYRAKKRREREKGLRRGLPVKKQRLLQYADDIKKRYATAVPMFERLVKEYPKSAVKDFASNFKAVPDDLSGLMVAITAIGITNALKLRDLEKIESMMVNIESKLDARNEILQEPKERLEELRKNKDSLPKLEEKVSIASEKAEKKFKNAEDVDDDAKDSLKKARKKYAEAKETREAKGPWDWIIIAGLLSEAIELYREALETQKESQSSYSYSSYSSSGYSSGDSSPSSYSSSSSDSGSFSGFGGGSSGGGGATGSW